MPNAFEMDENMVIMLVKRNMMTTYIYRYVFFVYMTEKTDNTQ